MPTKNTKFWFANRYVVITDDSDGPTVLIIYGHSDKYGHRNVKLVYEENGYSVKSAYQETIEEVEELLNELKVEFDELQEKMPPLYST